MPKVSIVIATYNRAHTIARSIASVLAQEHLLELIVVDDGSRDATAQVIEALHDPRIVYHRIGDNRGASYARNKGVELAKGEFIMVWDSDDVLYPQALSRVMQEFARDPSLGIVSAPARTVSGGQEIPFPRVPSGPITLEDVLTKKIPSNEKIRVARAGIMKDVSYKSKHIDFLVNVELIERGSWYHIDDYLGDVINDPERGSLTAARKKKNVQGSVDRAQYLADFLARHKETLLRASPPRYADYCYGAAVGFLLAGDARRARAFAWDAWRYHPTDLRHLSVLKLSWMPYLGSRLMRIFYR
jgi:glycosyltransferase involved in cell wall biosynthesis